MTTRTGQLGQDKRGGIAVAGQSGQDSQNRSARTRQPEHDRLTDSHNRITRTRQLDLDNHDGQNSQDMKPGYGSQNRAARTEYPEQDRNYTLLYPFIYPSFCLSFYPSLLPFIQRSEYLNSAKYLTKLEITSRPGEIVLLNDKSQKISLCCLFNCTNMGIKD
jgi:hypothetical protein